MNGTELIQIQHMLNLVLPLVKRVHRSASINSPTPSFGGLHPIRQWLNGLEIHSTTLAHLICRVIPTQCPFERDLRLLGHTLVRIPPLCKLNPFYEEVVGLRFRALCYLANECGEDIRRYC